MKQKRKDGKEMGVWGGGACKQEETEKCKRDERDVQDEREMRWSREGRKGTLRARWRRD